MKRRRLRPPVGTTGVPCHTTKKCQEKGLTRADNDAKWRKINPTQKQFSLNRAASKAKQFPISDNLGTVRLVGAQMNRQVGN